LAAATAGASPLHLPSGLGQHRVATSCCSSAASSFASIAASAGPFGGSVAKAEHLPFTASFATSFASTAASFESAKGYHLGHP